MVQHLGLRVQGLGFWIEGRGFGFIVAVMMVWLAHEGFRMEKKEGPAQTLYTSKRGPHALLAAHAVYGQNLA